MISLDILRGCAAVTVLMAHARGSSFVEFGLLPMDQQSRTVELFFFLTRLGGEAVLVFFVLSGFLVAGNVIHRVRDDAFNTLDYLIERGTRILIPLIPACVFTVLVNYFAHHEPLSLYQTILNIVGLNGVITSTLDHNAPLWSLAFEIWFYVIGGVVGYIISARRASALTLVLLIICGAVFSILDARFLLYWVLGGLTSYFVNVSAKVWLSICGVVMVVGGTVLVELASASKSFISVQYVPPAVSELLICGGICLSLPLLCYEKLNPSITMLSQVASTISGFSYSLYLFHYPVLDLCEFIMPRADRLSPFAIACFGLRILICVSVSYSMYLVFERNTPVVRRLLHRKTADSSP
jgi:peptidoglycan/LPS O-acetylase OafA/YrhL